MRAGWGPRFGRHRRPIEIDEELRPPGSLASHHPRAESRQLSVGSGASGSVPKGIRTVVQLAEMPTIPLRIVA
jgi:hypothetical protein